MRAFVTGGSGFIGQHLVARLLRRGFHVVGLARSADSAAQLAAAGAEVVRGDIRDPTSLREGMQGADLVIHLAARVHTEIGHSDLLMAVNVRGTQNVLTLAHRLGVARIIHLSSLAVFGDTRGEVVDESFQRLDPFYSAYDRSKWLAHYRVAVPLIEQGAPVMILLPGPVYGPGDPGLIADMMRLFYRGFPLLAGPRTTSTYTHVEDVAEGIVLAAERGRIAESYILAGPASSLADLHALWSDLTGKRGPILYLPAGIVRPWARIIGALPLPRLMGEGLIRALGRTFTASSGKARRELGWQARPLREGMQETLEWIAGKRA